jgi:hypothetical protein
MTLCFLCIVCTDKLNKFYMFINYLTFYINQKSWNLKVSPVEDGQSGETKYYLPAVDILWALLTTNWDCPLLRS